MGELARRGLSSGSMAVLYRGLKYAVYALLSLNIWLFLQEELVSASHATAPGTDILAWIQLYSATLDTAAWVILLLLFELETAVIPDHRLVGWTRWLIHSIRLACGVAIISAFGGYWGEWRVFASPGVLEGSACALNSADWSVLVDFDNFESLATIDCTALPVDLWVIPGLNNVLATPEAFASAWELALVDVINSGAWILVVVLLEIEVRLQLWGGVPRRLQPFFNAGKAALYFTLAIAAVYWGFEGEFLDFWDAALWLFAFVFIELNVFEWQQELQAQGRSESTTSSAPSTKA